MSGAAEMQQSMRRVAAGAAVADLAARWRTAPPMRREALEQLDAVLAPFGAYGWIEEGYAVVVGQGWEDTHLLGVALQRNPADSAAADSAEAGDDDLFDDALETLDDVEYEERWEDR
jgi:hypothetical protein